MMFALRSASRRWRVLCGLVACCIPEVVHALAVTNVTQNLSYATIQEAVNAAQPGDEIVANPGVYRENVNFVGKNLTLRSANPDDPAVVAATIINGDLDENPATAHGPVVTFENGESRRAVLAGFTLREGDGKTDPSESWLVPRGGGIYCRQASPTIRQNVIVANHAHMGGGVYINGGSPLLERNTIADNTATHSGGGIKAFNAADPLLRSEIRDNLIHGNKAFENDGGGADLYACPASAAPVIRNNVLAGNYAAGRGGGVACSSAFPVLRNNIICRNRSAAGGRGIHAYTNSAPVDICHNDVWSNPTPGSANNYGGAAVNHCATGELSIDPAFRSSGVWTDPNNTPANEADDVWQSGNYHLMSASGCINAGDPAVTPAPDERDIDGQARLLQTAVDIGADEANLSDRVYNLTRQTYHHGIQEAIYLAGSNDEIVAEPDTYHERVDFSGRAVHLHSVDPLDASVVDATIIQGPGDQDGGGPQVILGGGRLEGFTITGGWANIDGHGGGVTAYGAAIVAHNVIRSNRTDHMPAEVAGGVLAAGQALIVRNIIEENLCFASGAGGVLARDQAVVSENTIRGNGGLRTDAGGIVASDDVHIVANTVMDNDGGLVGGIYATDQVMIERNIVNHNRNDFDVVGAGGVWGDGTVFVVTNVVLNNSAFADAGGIRAMNGSVVVNNTLAWNFTLVHQSTGGVKRTADVVFRNNLVAFNSGGLVSGGISGACLQSDYNCVFGNSCSSSSCPGDYGSGAAAGEHDVHLNPMLAPDGYQLLYKSPCVNAGEMDGTCGGVDIDGHPRVRGGRVDIGASEAAHSGPPDFDRDGDADLDDLAIMAACRTRSKVPHDGTESCIESDFDHDGDVDMEDFGLFQRRCHQ